MIKERLCIAFLASSLIGCVTPYQSTGFTGGHSVKQLQSDIWRVHFSGNGNTTYETVQTYWLYRCAELTLEQGYDGFQILSDIRFARFVPLESIGLRGESPYPLLAGKGTTPVYFPVFVPVPTSHPKLTGDIKLLKLPFDHTPPKVFDATTIKNALDRYVHGEKCDGNVCAHVHDYVLPPGTLPN
jgi:hypothetical protein